MTDLSYSRGPDLVIGDDPRTLAGWLVRAAAVAPRAGVLVQPALQRTEFTGYPELLDRARTAAAGLRSRGVGPGDHVVLQFPCSTDYFVAVWGCVLAGARPVTVARPSRHTGDDPVLAKLVAVWADLGHPVLLADRETDVTGGPLATATVLTLAPATPATPATPAGPAGPAGLAGPGTPPGAPFGGSAATSAAESAESVGTALALVSSGSTGRPKIVPLTQRGLLELGVAARLRLDLRPGDVTFNWLPLDHSGAFLLFHLAAVFAGVTNVQVPTDLVTADPSRLLDLLRRHRVTHAWWPNFGYRLLTDVITADPSRPWDLSSLRVLLNGGEQCTLPVVRGFLDAAAPFGVTASTLMFTWGMTETTTAITYSRFDDPSTVRDGLIGVGTPDPGAELRIVDAAGALVPRGTVGRLQVRSARVTPGYLNDHEATERADAGDGWFVTGDLAVMHDDAVTITGRENDLIILYGKNHMAPDLEAALTGANGVPCAVAACGVPDPHRGTERLVVFLEAAGSAEEGALAALAGRVRAALASRRGITDVLLVAVPELPRTTSGKVRRAELRDRFLAGDLTPLPPPPQPAQPAMPVPAPSLPSAAWSARPGPVEVVTGVFAEVVGHEVAPDRPFYELGVTSLHVARVHELLATRLGRALPRTALFEHPTVLALAAHLARSTEPPTRSAVGSPSSAVDGPVAGDRRIAIIGMAARLPGAATPEAFWANLRAGVCSVRRFSADELPEAADPAVTAAAATIDGIDEFDAELFGMSAREAALTDPAQRLFLQCCRHAMEHAGHGAPTGRVGVFAGCGMNLYPGHDYRPGAPDDPVAAVQATIGNRPDFLATRVAYRLGLTGPALSVQTACSTALVAVHLAARSLLAGECDLALAGAASVHVPQVTGYRAVAGSILSPTGCCRPFDAAADGTVGGSGVAAVLLKPLAAALADGDTVHAVLLGSAVGNDGAGKVSFTAPSVAGQVRTIREALASAGVPARSIGYVEAHGTGTSLGDPVEVAALTRAFRPDPNTAGSTAARDAADPTTVGGTADDAADPAVGAVGMGGSAGVGAGAGEVGEVGWCGLGSVKANVGHLDSCAGMAGLLKAVFALGTGELAPQINLRAPHPDLDLAASPFFVPTEAAPFPGDGPRRALVCALGVGGTNAHVVLEQPPAPRPRAGHRPLGVLPLSADSPHALAELAAAHQESLRTNGIETADVLRTAAVGRWPHRYRLAATGTTPQELARSLATAVPSTGGPPRVVFCFAGQGGSPVDVEPLRLRFPVFADTWDAATAGHDVAPDSQLALFAHGVALAALWRSWGVTPELVLGHSVGEYAALCVAGALDLADGARLTAARGRLMRDAAPAGAMVAVFEPRDRIDDLLTTRDATVELAVVNGSAHQLLGGAPAAVDALVAELDRRGLAYRRLAVPRAFHTSAMDGMLDGLRAELAGVRLRPLAVPLASTVGETGVLPAGTVPDRDHLVRHAREVVRFDLACAAIADGLPLELGGDGLLSRIGGAGWVPSLRRGADPLDTLAAAVAELYRQGVPLDWAAVTAGCAGRRVPLPLYPYRRVSHWHHEPDTTQGGRPVGDPAPDLANTPTAPATEAAAATADAAHSVDLTEILDAIRQVVARQVGVSPDAVTPDSSLVRLGADSLAMVALVGELDTRFGVRLGMRELFAPDPDGSPAADTPRRIATLIATRRPPPPLRPTTPTAPVPPAVAPAAGRPAAVPVGQAVTGVGRPVAGVGQGGGDQGAAERVVAQQLGLMAEFSAIMRQQLDLLAAAPAQPFEAPAVGRPTVRPIAAVVPGGTAPSAAVADAEVAGGPDRSLPRGGPGRVEVEPLPPVADHPALAVPPVGTCDFSVYFFGDYPQAQPGERPDRYRAVLETARFADRHGFHAVWLPERHFHSFGGIFPNPSVLAAAIAGQTERIRLHAGSVVLPLHHPIRVAEEWSVVDNLSGGRAGLCVASGWHAGDFVLRPENYGPHKELMYRDLDTVRALWAGDAVTGRSGTGEAVEVRLYPRPVQEAPPLYVAIVGNPESYRAAGASGLGVVTNLMTQSVEALAQNLRTYRQARRDAGLDPATGRVVVLLHTFLDDDADAARRTAFEPFCRYLRSSLSLFGGVTNSLGFDIDLDRTPEDDLRFMLEQAYDRYCESRALIGSPDSVAPTVEALLAAGAHELACFVDFGLDPDVLLAGLPAADRLRRRYSPSTVDIQEVHDTSDTTESAPLSSAQRRMWLLHEMFRDRPMYNEPRAIALDGELDVTALRRALTQLVAAHPALRTVFRAANGEPRQYVGAATDVDCPLVDHQGADEDSVVRAVMAGESRRRFDLAAGPALLASLLRFSPTRHVLVLSVHHIVSDGLSWVVLFRDLASCYAAWRDGGPAELTPQRTSYLRYARDQQAARGQDTTRADLRFWLDRLRGLPPVLELPADRPRPAVMGGDGRSLFVHVDAGLTARLRGFARERGMTPFMVLLAGFTAMLSAYTGQGRFALGVAAANRPPGTEDVVGMFVDTLPLPMDTGGDPTFAELVSRIRLTTAESFDHARLPFDELVAALNPPRDPGRNPVFQVMVEYENDAGTGFELPGLTATLLEVAPDKAPFDLTCYLANLAETVQCHLEYNAELFDEATVRRFVAHFVHVLDVATAAPDVPMSRLPALSAGDVTALESWQGRASGGGGRLHDRFVRHAAAHPDVLAVDAGTPGGRLSYRQVDERANRLARLLHRLGVGTGDVVAVRLPPGADLVVALLGVLKAGAAYLPLDPAGLLARSRFQLADSGAEVLVTTGECDLDAGTVLRLDDDALLADLAAEPATAPTCGATPDTLAYVIYTSGSTGRPKGVAMPHRGPAAVLGWYVGAHPPLRTLQWTSCAFDVSVLEIFATPSSGGTVVPMPDGLRHDPRGLWRWLREHEVQRIGMPFTPLATLAQAVADDPAVPSLREIVTIGEALRLTPALRALLAANPSCRLFNEYGPTETSVIVTSHEVDPAGEDAVPIGRPVDGVRVHLLGGDGRPVPVGAVGELHLAGPFLAYGYLGRPAQTAAAFVPDPHTAGGRLYRTGDLARWRTDGTLHFLGRIDDQVKIRGHRVEPGEVAAVLREQPEVTDAAVLVRTGHDGEPQLAAYVVAAPGSDPGLTAELATRLAGLLPDHMVPRAWATPSGLPLTTSGKLDRSRLPEPAPAGAVRGAGRTPDPTGTAAGTVAGTGVGTVAVGGSGGARLAGDVEQVLLKLWLAQLGPDVDAEDIGPDTSFFGAGGHSLSAMRMLDRVREQFGVEYPVLAFFQEPTIGAMTTRLDGPRRVRGTV